MWIDTDDAPATAEHEGEIYCFCSQACHDAFVADPASLSILLDRLTEDELAERSRIGSERVRELVRLGILRPVHGTFARGT